MKDSEEKRIQNQFGGFCTRVLKNEANRIHNGYSRQREWEEPLDHMGPVELSQIAVEDRYFQDDHIFEVLGVPVVVTGDVLAEILAQLPEGKRDIILLSFFPPHRSSDGQQTPNRHFEGPAQNFREGGIRMVGTVRPSIPVQTILKAVNGETEALDAVLRHYSSYIRVLSTRPVKDTYGNEFLCVDESMRDQLEAKLRVSIVTAFKVLPV